MKLQKIQAIVMSITLPFILITNLQTWANENPQTVKKELPAAKTDQPPTIDGILDDACWQDAPQAIGFTDERTEKPAKNQSVGWLVYTDEAIYVGLHLYDEMPDKIVARQVKDQTRISGEDWVSFSLDPFHTHQFSDRNFFIVNPLGTKYAHLATGRAEKSEWIGLWKTAAQIVEDGWVVEMEIPWQNLLRIAPIRICWHRLFYHPRRPECIRIQTAFSGKSPASILECHFSAFALLASWISSRIHADRVDFFAC